MFGPFVASGGRPLLARTALLIQENLDLLMATKCQERAVGPRPPKGLERMLGSVDAILADDTDFQVYCKRFAQSAGPGLNST